MARPQECQGGRATASYGRRGRRKRSMTFAPYNPVCYSRLPNARAQAVCGTPAIFKK
jgi:hypothetical protein